MDTKTATWTLNGKQCRHVSGLVLQFETQANNWAVHIIEGMDQLPAGDAGHALLEEGREFWTRHQIGTAINPPA